MILTHREQLKANIDRELNTLVDWSESPEIRCEVKRQFSLRRQLLERAYMRIRNGTYGECESCHQEIEFTILQADPAFPSCRACTDLKHRFASNNKIEVK